MSVWGKILGGLGGFALGGPLGALLGAFGGHMFDSARKSASPSTQNMAFTMAVIVLGAKMAKADGRVTQDEIQAFKEVFRIHESEMHDVGRLFNEAKRDAQGFEPYAQQIASMFRQQPQLLEELLWCLTYIAKADGDLHDKEREFLERVASIFGMSHSTFERITGLAQGSDPYTVLGLDKNVDDQTLKARYRTLARENHPDLLVSQGLPQEFIDMAERKLTLINAAYENIKQERGLS